MDKLRWQRLILSTLAGGAVVCALAGAYVPASGLAGALLATMACLWALTGPAAPAPVPDSAERAATLEESLARVRHDLNGILSPALLTADRLTGHEDPRVRRAGEVMMTAVERAAARLNETKSGPRAGAAG